MDGMEKGLWRIGDASAFLGLTRHSVYKMVERREIPHVRIGHRILFEPKGLEAWVRDHTVTPNPSVMERFKA